MLHEGNGATTDSFAPKIVLRWSEGTLNSNHFEKALLIQEQAQQQKVCRPTCSIVAKVPGNFIDEDAEVTVTRVHAGGPVSNIFKATIEPIAPW